MKTRYRNPTHACHRKARIPKPTLQRRVVADLHTEGVACKLSPTGIQRLSRRDLHDSRDNIPPNHQIPINHDLIQHEFGWQLLKLSTAFCQAQDRLEERS